MKRKQDDGRADKSSNKKPNKGRRASRSRAGIAIAIITLVCMPYIVTNHGPMSGDKTPV
ncbi:hypothetical protein KY5_4194 [Streptomyces formicae]|uniref:Uncharacterized protein n=1 Tax=Streptomyces formicae TaxID=1616117 RepID=A0A291QC64_9ACTN|nr:hypothetical protein KY5_4194 [Streptomyces formicae]